MLAPFVREINNLVIELINLMVAVRDLRILPCNLCDQIAGQFAQLLCVQTGQ